MIEAAALLIGAAILASLVIGRMHGADAEPAAESGLAIATAVALSLAIASTITSIAFLMPTDAAGSSHRIVTRMFLGLALGVAVAWRRQARVPRIPRTVPHRAGMTRPMKAILAVVSIAAVYVVVARLSRRPDGEWDAFAFWNLRARLFHRAAADTRVIFSEAMPASHPDYPLLLSGLVAAGWSVFGEGVTAVTGAIALLFGALAAGALFAAVAPRRGGTAACLAVLAYLASPHVLREVAWRYADIPLSAFLVLACGWLAAAYDGAARAKSSVALAGLCVSLGAWTKNEGIVHGLVLGFVLLVRPPAPLTRIRALRAYGSAALPFLLVLVAFKVTYAPPNDLTAGTDGAGALARLADGSRYRTIAAHLCRELGRWSHWCYLLPAAALVAVLGRRRDEAARAIGLAVGLLAIAYFFVYVLTPQPLVWHLEHSFDRLVLQLYPSILLLAALKWPGSARVPATDRPPPFPAALAQSSP